ncbi:RHS repeat-associated core domain-containing protein, partial [Pedobacter polaris]
KKYLPYAEQTGSDGSYRATAIAGQAAFYGTSGWDANVVKTPYPYSQAVLEASPIGRVLEQGAPGAVWQPYNAAIAGSGHTVRADYSSNVTGEVPLWVVGPSGASTSGSYYAANRLYKTISRDENWTGGKAGTTEEFKDLEGRVVMKKIWETESVGLSTHYIYDDLGNLRYVVPPAVTATGFTETGDANFENYIYGYHYDGRKRLIEKKVPGKGWEYMVYNRLDQLVLSQDAVQRGDGRWFFSKYDALGRSILTGIITSALDRSVWQATVDTASVLWESRDNTNSNGIGMGYSNLSLPTGNFYNYYTVTYYDDYDFYQNPFGGPITSEAPVNRTKGLVTGMRTLVIGNGAMPFTVSYYDTDGRLVRTKSQNHLGGTDVVNSSYDFVGQLKTSARVHIANGATTTIANSYSYDHMGRKISTRENINSQGEVTLNKLEYNEIGQVRAKGLHGLGNGSPDGVDITLAAGDILTSGQSRTVKASGSITLAPGFEAQLGSTFNASIVGMLQNTEYAYNERGWLKGSTSDQFRMQLDYQDGTHPQFNGNIANQRWGGSLGNVFTYQYDKLNRLFKGEVSPTVMSEVITYDVMGNITSLSRDGGTAGSYGYVGNRLTGISGGPLATGSYAYDANGNATTDGRTGVTLGYNFLNLPATAIKSGLSLAYTYDATGQKLRKVSSTAGTTDYVDGIQYTNGTIDFIQTEEGRAVNNSGTYKYEYNLSDHLGNVRYSFDIYNGAVRKLQEDNYYAFGLRHSATAGTNNYLYNGKELQDELGQYDYGARFYDPIIGRWNVVDPLAEADKKTTPYAYVFNNPLRFVDPDGMFGDYYAMNGQYLGSDGIKDDKVYAVADGGVRSTTVSGNKATRRLDPSKITQLGIGHKDFLAKAATIFGESSASLVNQSPDLKNEMFAIASVHERNQTAYGASNDAATAFKDASPMERNGTKKQYAVAAEINAQLGGKDLSYGATQWDGVEQSLYPATNNKKSQDGYELHMNTQGWSISNDHYKKWKENVGTSFVAPQVKTATTGPNKGQQRLTSTAVYLKTIFWRAN